MATISFTTKFDLASATKQIIWTDTTDWAGQGIALANVNMNFMVTAPSGTVIYNNTDYDNADCDIWINNDLESQQTVPLPLVLDDVEPGTYTIVGTVYNSALAVYYTTTNTYTFDFENPEVEIEQTANCVNPSFVSQDSTNYDVNGITPTITRTHKLFYPDGNEDGATFLTSAAATIQTGTFYDGTQTTTISTALTYVNSDGLTIVTVVTGRQEFKVDCTFICSVLCCINDYRTRMLDQRGVNEVKFAEMSKTFSLAVGLVSTAKFNIECGLPDNVNDLLQEAYRITGCTANCTCSDSTVPSRVTGLGGLVSVSVVASGGAPVVVTPVTVGSTTTYTVTLSSSFVNIVNSSYNTVVAAGSGIGVADSGIVAGVRTFTISNTNANPVLHNDTAQVTTANPAMTVLMSYTLPINKLSTDGSSLELIAIIDSNLSLEAKAFDIRIAGVVCHSKSTTFRIAAGEISGIINVVITRQSDTELFIQFLQNNSGVGSYTGTNTKQFFETGFVVPALSANTTLIEVRGMNQSGGAEQARLNQLMITYSKK